MRNRSFVGIALVSLSDSSNNDQSNSPLPKVGRAPVWGDFLAIVSTRRAYPRSADTHAFLTLRHAGNIYPPSYLRVVVGELDRHVDA